MQSPLWLLLILGFLGLCDAHVDVSTDADQSTSPQAAVAPALITSKTSFAKHVEGKTGFLPGLLEESEESESLLMESELSELEMDPKEDSEIISTPEALSDNAFCSLLLVLRSILLGLLLHLALVVYKRKTQTEAEDAEDEATGSSSASSASPCASLKTSKTWKTWKTWKTRTLNDTDTDTSKSLKIRNSSGSISDTNRIDTQAELSHPQTPQTVSSQRGTPAEATSGKLGGVGAGTCSSGFGEFELHVAAAEANLEEMAKLLKKGVDVNAVDAWDETALHMAARSRSFAACELLLQNKADVNARNADDRTPLACVTDAAHAAHAAHAADADVTDVTDATDVDDPVSLCHLLLQHGAVLGSEDALQRCCATALVESLLRGEAEAEKICIEDAL